MTEEQLEALMVRVVDGLATDSEQQSLSAAVADRPDLQQELRAHRALKATTDGWVSRLTVDAIEDRWTHHPATRVERVLGVALVVAGIAGLVGFGLWELWLDPTAPLWLKGGTAAVLAGFAVLSVSVVRYKLATRGRDPYTEVIR